ncbi:hypothetical protein RJ219_002002 [Enterobacter hormaechei]|nr:MULTISPECIES: hypothetical protein [Enterobacter]WBN64283.1 hypothetical protein KHW01_17100 [Enterobacter cloacae]EKT9329767.1 hypothetical protein [Enterobacter hormaechei]EKW2262047.1 hypothetical protein [Enterobacter hormaechei]EKW6224751.1 hypothetical protein [Enterobacter hormaechei]EKW9489576.1 hypothetical protein [Enterobacter hormaechei]
MSTFQPYKKGTVLAPSGPCNHLHVICNDPVYYPVNDCYCILVVNVSSIKPGVPHDDACVLNPGDHRFIQHPSYIVYAEAVIWRVDNVARKHAAGEITAHDDMPEAAFERVLSGFDISEQAKPKHIRFKEKYCTNTSLIDQPEPTDGLTGT